MDEYIVQLLKEKKSGFIKPRLNLWKDPEETFACYEPTRNVTAFFRASK